MELSEATSFEESKIAYVGLLAAGSRCLSVISGGELRT